MTGSRAGAVTPSSPRAPGGRTPDTGPQDAGRAPRRSPLQVAAWVLAGAVVLVQITYPLLSGEALTSSTIATVLLFATASLVSATATHGLRAAAVLLVVAGSVGLVAEAVGVATSVPFGAYGYTETLGPQIASVPVVIPLAWTMMAWPTLLAGRGLAAALVRRAPRLASTRRWLPIPLAGWALASWDLYLDPQMVEAGHWVWEDTTPALPGIEGIPISNFAGWLLVALVMQALLHLLVPSKVRPGPGGEAARQRARDGWGPPAVLLAWTWLGSALANVAFFGRPGVGLWGLVVMGLVVGPWLLLTWRDQRAAGPRAGDPAPGRDLR